MADVRIEGSKHEESFTVDRGSKERLRNLGSGVHDFIGTQEAGYSHKRTRPSWSSQDLTCCERPTSSSPPNHSLQSNNNVTRATTTKKYHRRTAGSSHISKRATTTQGAKRSKSRQNYYRSSERSRTASPNVHSKNSYIPLDDRKWDEVWDTLPPILTQASKTPHHSLMKPQHDSSLKYMMTAVHPRPYTENGSLIQRPVNPFFLSNESPLRPFTTQTVNLPVTRRPKTALSPLPLPFLDVTSNACRGWLYHRGMFAHEIIDYHDVDSKLQWRPYYYVADSKSRTLVQMCTPEDRRARMVANLADATVCARGLRVLPNGATLYIMEVQWNTGFRGQTETWFLGCEMERTTLRWLQVLRLCTLGETLPIQDSSIEDPFPDPIGIEHENIIFSDDENEDEDGETKHVSHYQSLKVFDGTSLHKELEQWGFVIGSKGNVITRETVSAQVIQSVWRGHIARQLVYGKQGVFARHVASIKLQAWIRQKQALVVFHNLRSRQIAAITIENSFRCYLARCKLYSIRANHQAAKVIQGALRCYLARKVIKNLQQIKRQIILEFLSDSLDVVEKTCNNYAELRHEITRRTQALRIQTHWRMFCARRIVQTKREYFAIIRLQALFRQRNERRKFLDTKNNALRIQAVVRGHAGRVVVENLLHEHYGARQIQRIWRGHAGRQGYVTALEAALRLTSFARYVLACRKVASMREEYLNKSRAAGQIQSCVRGWLARTKFIRQRRDYEAAVQVQSWIRCVQSRAKFTDTKAAALTLQLFWRQYEARNLVKCLLKAKEHKAATSIQQAFRAYLFWSRLEESRENLVKSWCTPGCTIFRGALRTSEIWFMVISSVDETLNLKVVIYNGDQTITETVSNQEIFRGGPLKYLMTSRTELPRRVAEIITRRHQHSQCQTESCESNYSEKSPYHTEIGIRATELFARELAVCNFMNHLYLFHYPKHNDRYRNPLRNDPQLVHLALFYLNNTDKNSLVEDNDLQSVHSSRINCCSSEDVANNQNFSVLTDLEVSEVVRTFHPTSLFQIDVEICANEQTERQETISSLHDAEGLVLKALSEEAGSAMFTETLHDLRASLRTLAAVKIELQDDIDRWITSHENLKGKDAIDHEVDPSRANFQIAELNYLKKKIDSTQKVLDLCNTTIEDIQGFLAAIEDAQKRFRRAHEVSMNLFTQSRVRRNRLRSHECAILPKALSYYQLCTKRTGQIVAGELCNSKRDLHIAYQMLAKYLLPARIECEDLRGTRNALKCALSEQGNNVEQLSEGVLRFTNRVEALKGTIKQRLQEAQNDLESSREEWLQVIEDAGNELSHHRELYERLHSAEQEAQEIIDEEQAAVEAYEQYVEETRPRSKEEKIDDIEKEIIFAFEAFDLARRIKRFHLIVENCATKAQRMSFEARQMTVASARAQELNVIVTANDFDMLEDQCIRISKRLKTALFLLDELQGSFEFHYPELRRKLFSLKDEHQHEQNLKRSNSEVDSQISDSDSDYSIPEEYAEGKMKLQRAARNCIRDVDYLTDLCSEWAELVGEEEISKRRALADPEGANGRRDSTLTGQNKQGVLRRLANLPKETAQRTYILYLNQKYHFRSHVLDPTIKRAADPFGSKKQRQNEAATIIQRHWRGWICRRRLLIQAVIRVQMAYRKFRAYRRFQDALLASTAKYYDVISCQYYYVWASGKVAWSPPEPIADRYIPYGRRTKRSKDHEWTETEAATLIQSVARARMERKRYVRLVLDSYEKVYEPSRNACFYQNKATGKCQWHKPLGLGLFDLPIANLDDYETK